MITDTPNGDAEAEPGWPASGPIPPPEPPEPERERTHYVGDGCEPAHGAGDPRD